MVDGWYVAEARFPAKPMARLVYYACLAPSTRNSQPWKFVAASSDIDVFADRSRWLRSVDPEARELHLSVGCAIEALRIAADHAGYGTETAYFPVEHDDSLVARVTVALGGPKRDAAAADLLKPLVTRHTSRRLFDPAKPVSEADRKYLYRCFEFGDVSLHFLHERAGLDALAALEERAKTRLLERPGYRREAHPGLGALPLGHLLLSRHPHGDAERVASAPLVALLTTRHDLRIDQVRAGEAFMRLALVAEARDIRVQPMTQILEANESHAELAHLFGSGGRVAQHLFRMGHAEAESRGARRRPLDSVLIQAG